MTSHYFDKHLEMILSSDYKFPDNITRPPTSEELEQQYQEWIKNKKEEALQEYRKIVSNRKQLKGA